jgi:hypothetical protein
MRERLPGSMMKFAVVTAAAIFPATIRRLLLRPRLRLY